MNDSMSSEDRETTPTEPEGPGEEQAATTDLETPGESLEDVLADHRDGEAEANGEVAEPEPDPYDPFAPAPEPEEGEEDDGDDLPDAPLFGLLRVLAQEITPERMDRVWVFPPRRIEVAETAVVVVAAYLEIDHTRHRVFAAHYTALDDSEEHRLVVDEYGAAPTDRVGRLVEEAVERIKDGPVGAPRSFRIQGDERAWDETLHQLAEQYLEERQRNRRLR